MNAASAPISERLRIALRRLILVPAIVVGVGLTGCSNGLGHNEYEPRQHGTLSNTEAADEPLVPFLALSAGADASSQILILDSAGNELTRFPHIDSTAGAVEIGATGLTYHTQYRMSGRMAITRLDGSSAGEVVVGNYPAGLAVAPAGLPNTGNIYVGGKLIGDSPIAREFTSEGEELATIQLQDYPDDIEVGPAGTAFAGNLLYGNRYANTVYVTGVNGVAVGQIATGFGPTRLAIAPAGVSTAGMIYVGSLLEPTRVDFFASDGTPQGGLVLDAEFADFAVVQSGEAIGQLWVSIPDYLERKTTIRAYSGTGDLLREFSVAGVVGGAISFVG